MAGEHTLTETESAVTQKLDGLVLDFEAMAIAAEGGFSKATLSGVLTTLESRGFVSRSKSETVPEIQCRRALRGGKYQSQGKRRGG